MLIGGAGRRMGGAKATCCFQNRPLWLYGFELLQGFCSEVNLVGVCPEIELPALAEPELGLGPLAGMQVALQACNTEWAFILALDYPLLDMGFVTQLGLPIKGQARLPTCGQQRHPLCGYYHRTLQLPGRGSVLRALDQLEGVEWVDFGTDARFLNVNYPADLQV